MLAQTKQHAPFVFCKFQSMFMGLSQFNCSTQNEKMATLFVSIAKWGIKGERLLVLVPFPVSVIKHPVGAT